MNKAKITYRFDTDKNHLKEVRVPLNNNNPVPLHKSQPNADASTENVEMYEKTGEWKAKQPPPIYDVQPLNQFTSDFGAWSSPFDIETEKLEKLIKESDSAKRDESNSSEPKPLYLTDAVSQTATRSGPDISELTTAHYARRSGFKAPAWGKMLLSASSAVITGVLLGTLILNFFPDSMESVMETTPVTEIPAADSQSQIHPGNGQDNGSESSVDIPVLSSLELPSENYYFLQNGVFSSAESAAEAQAILKEKGMASIVDSTDGYRVYAGFSNDRDEALYLSNRIEQHDLETYIKTIERPAITKIEWPEEGHEALEAYLKGSSEMIRTMNAWTTQLLRSDSGSLTNEQLSQLKDLHQVWSNHAANVTTAATAELSPHLSKMNAFMNTSVESFMEYTKNPYETYLWQAQAAMMQYILLEQAFIEAVAPEKGS